MNEIINESSITVLVDKIIAEDKLDRITTLLSELNTSELYQIESIIKIINANSYKDYYKQEIKS